MKTLHLSLIVFASGMFFLTIPSGMATTFSTTTTEQPITVELDKNSYNRDDIMIVSGEVKKIVNNTPLTLQIMDPVGNLVHVEQIEIASDGKFTLPIRAGGLMWSMPGNYTLAAQYGFKHVSAIADFQFKEMETPVTGIFNVKENTSGQNFDLNYTITGGKVNKMYLEPQDLSLVVEVDTKNFGVLHLSIPRLMLDATRSDNTDEIFLIYVNEDEMNTFTEEKASSTHRVLDIPISPDDTKIEIIGTTVIPEFGTIAQIVLVISLMSIIAISAKTRLRFVAKFRQGIKLN